MRVGVMEARVMAAAREVDHARLGVLRASLSSSPPTAAMRLPEMATAWA